MVQRKRTPARFSHTIHNSTILFLLVTLSLAVVSLSFSASRNIPSQQQRQTHSILRAETEPIDRKSAIIGGGLLTYTIFELSGTARKVEDSTGIGIGALKNATVAK